MIANILHSFFSIEIEDFESNAMRLNAVSHSASASSPKHTYSRNSSNEILTLNPLPPKEFLNAF